MAAGKLRKAQKIYLAIIFSHQQGLLQQFHALYTAQPLVSASVHNTRPAFLLNLDRIPLSHWDCAIHLQ